MLLFIYTVRRARYYLTVQHTGLTLPFPSERGNGGKRRKRKRARKEKKKKIDRVRIKRWENRKLIALASR